MTAKTFSQTFILYFKKQLGEHQDLWLLTTQLGQLDIIGAAKTLLATPTDGILI